MYFYYYRLYTHMCCHVALMCTHFLNIRNIILVCNNNVMLLS